MLGEATGGNILRTPHSVGGAWETRLFIILWSLSPHLAQAASALVRFPHSELQIEERCREPVGWVSIGKPGHFIKSLTVPDLL